MRSNFCSSRAGASRWQAAMYVHVISYRLLVAWLSCEVISNLSLSFVTCIFLILSSFASFFSFSLLITVVEHVSIHLMSHGNIEKMKMFRDNVAIFKYFGMETTFPRDWRFSFILIGDQRSSWFFNFFRMIDRDKNTVN